MRTSTYIIVFTLFSILLSACGSTPVYKPAHGSEYGYRETRIDDDRYRISFKTRGDNIPEAMDYALLRAAELTLLKGYDWFVVVDRQTQLSRRSVAPMTQIATSRTIAVQRDCGLLACRTTAYPMHTNSMQLNMGLSQGRDKTQGILEIRMGKGERPGADNSYVATNLVSTIGVRTR